MFIAYLHRTKGRGVEGVHINEIIRQFRNLGHEVIVISPTTSTNDEKPGEKGHAIGRFNVEVPELVFELMELCYNFVGYLKLKKACRQSTPDLIYERYSIFNIFGIYFGKKYGVKIVIEANYTSMLPLVRKRNYFLKPLAKLFDRYTFRNADRIVAVSSYIKNHLITDFNIPSQKIIVLPNAADPEKFKYIEFLEDNEKKIIGFVGGFYPWHGLDFLVKVFARLLRENPEVELHLVGDGPERALISRLVESLGITNSVKFVGKVNHSELSNYISRFYVGVMPDSNMYGSPMKIFEYMSMGVPVIVPDYPPILDAIDDNIQGLIFEKKDSADMLRCLRHIISAPKIRRTLSIEARKLIVSGRNWKNNAICSIADLESR